MIYIYIIFMLIGFYSQTYAKETFLMNNFSRINSNELQLHKSGLYSLFIFQFRFKTYPFVYSYSNGEYKIKNDTLICTEFISKNKLCALYHPKKIQFYKGYNFLLGKPFKKNQGYNHTKSSLTRWRALKVKYSTRYKKEFQEYIKLDKKNHVLNSGQYILQNRIDNEEKTSIDIREDHSFIYNFFDREACSGTWQRKGNELFFRDDKLDIEFKCLLISDSKFVALNIPLMFVEHIKDQIFLLKENSIKETKTNRK